MNHPLHRTLPVLAGLGIAVSGPLFASAAHAVGRDCGAPTVQYSVDGGAHWVNDDRMPAPHGTIQVRLAGEPFTGCDYKVSLAPTAPKARPSRPRARRPSSDRPP
ncbi:hypothetical protein ACWC9T_18855 [Kitasatospora sp. NPDC001159]